MSYKFLLLFTCLLSTSLLAQNTAINNTGAPPDASAILDVSSSSKGLLIPRMSSSAISSITNPAKSLLVMDTTKNQLMVNMGTAAVPNWQTVVFSSGWSLGGNSGTNSSTQFLGTTDNKPLNFRVNNLYAGQLHPLTGNVFWGMAAGQNNAGYSNVGIGRGALFSNSAISNTVAIGDSALYNNQNTNNTAVGSKSLYSNMGGFHNTAIGFESLYSNSEGVLNTAIGSRALYSNTNGHDNIAVGNNALFYNNGSLNTALGSGALTANTTGGNNTATGMNALNSNTTANNNAAYGTGSMYYNTTGANNTANGYQSLYTNTTASGNTAIGYQSLFTNSLGNYNTATGYHALYSNPNGSYNAAFGSDALSSNTSDNNAAFGTQALLSNTTGKSNTALGMNSLLVNTTASNNTAVGFSALSVNNSYDNTAAGYQAGDGNSTGHSNTAIGKNALSNNGTGSNNVAIGAESGTNGSFENTVSIGNIGWLNASSNQVFLGNASTTWIGGWVGWSVYSDGRIKNQITEDVKGLDFIKRLRPVTYHRSIDIAAKLTGNKPVNNFPGKYDIEKIKYSGFIAQEVEKAANESGYEFSGVKKPHNEKDLYTLDYSSFVVPLVKAVQEQQSIIEKQNKLIEDLMNRVKVLEQKK